MAPTLCYQMNYPRSPPPRWTWLAGKFAQFIFFVSLAVLMLEQFCMPLVKNSVEPLDSLHIGRIIERVMKLSVRFSFHSFNEILLINTLPLTDTKFVYLVNNVLRILSFVVEYSRGIIAFWRSSILFRLVVRPFSCFVGFSFRRQIFLPIRNATTMDYYWRTWNIPTHHWLLRHIYFPALRHGFNRDLAAFLVFLFSAIFHEVRQVPLKVR